MSTEKNKDNKQVRVILLIGGNWSKTKETEKYSMPKDYLCNAKELPKELIQQSIDNGWTDSKGNVYFPETFQPDPVKGEDGNVYLVMNDRTKNRDEYVLKALELLKIQKELPHSKQV